MRIMLGVKKDVDANELKMFYHSLIQPYFEYCNIIYATNHIQPIKLLFRKKAIRVITLSTLRAHSKPSFINNIY